MYFQVILDLFHISQTRLTVNIVVKCMHQCIFAVYFIYDYDNGRKLKENMAKVKEEHDGHLKKKKHTRDGEGIEASEYFKTQTSRNKEKLSKSNNIWHFLYHFTCNFIFFVFSYVY